MKSWYSDFSSNYNFLYKISLLIIYEFLYDLIILGVINNNAKDPKVKSRLKKAYDYAKKRKEASKEKTKRLLKKRQLLEYRKKNYKRLGKLQWILVKTLIIRAWELLSFSTKMENFILLK